MPALLRSGEWVVTVGDYDPLTAVQAERLTSLHPTGGKLLAIVLEKDEALLAAPARAALVAALRVVDAVAVSQGENWRAAIASTSHVRIVEDAAAEERRSADFVRYILDRQLGASGGGALR